MEVILKKDVSGLGQKNDLVKVKPGFGRNFLIPQGIAVTANATNKKVAQENARQAAHKVAQLKQAAEALAARLATLDIAVAAKASESGKIFGTITASQLAKALQAYEIEVDRKNIRFSQSVKELGTHEATIALHKDVVHALSFRVVAER